MWLYNNAQVLAACGREEEEPLESGKIVRACVDLSLALSVP